LSPAQPGKDSAAAGGSNNIPVCISSGFGSKWEDDHSRRGYG
jgi:hypothetical protein